MYFQFETSAMQMNTNDHRLYKIILRQEPVHVSFCDFILSSLSHISSSLFVALTCELCPAMAGWQLVCRPGQWRVEPSKSAPGGVWCPPSRPQSPVQGRTAQGVERPGAPCSEHLRPAEGPTHINQTPKLPDLVTRKKETRTSSP